MTTENEITKSKTASRTCSNCKREIEFIIDEEVYKDWEELSLHCTVRDKETQEILSYILSIPTETEITATCLCSQKVTFTVEET